MAVGKHKDRAEDLLGQAPMWRSARASLRLHFMANSLFNENAGAYSLRGLRYPLPLNRYAGTADDAPYGGYRFFDFGLKN